MRAMLITLAVAAAAAYAGSPESYRFTCDYYTLDVQGNLLLRQRLTGRYTRDLPGGKMRWNDVSLAQGKDFDGPLGPAEKRDFMEGFTYQLADMKDMLRPEFFKGFPAAAMQERNLVWDTHMLEQFGERQLDRLKLNVPIHLDSGEVPLAGAGRFHNKDVQVVLTGYSERNGHKCLLLDYTAFFNQFDISTPGLKFVGRSHYWGQIWVSETAREIEYATLFEDVLGNIKLEAAPQLNIVNIFRRGVFERASQKQAHRSPENHARPSTGASGLSGRLPNRAG